MSGRNWNKAAQRDLMARNGVEDRADTTSKDALRRQADRLLAGYTGPVTRAAPGTSGSHVIGSQVSGEIPRSVTGNISSQATCRSKRTVESTAPKARKSKGGRPQTDLFGTASRSVPNRNAFDRSVPPGLVIYCDGACEPNPGVGGWAYVVYRDGKEVHSDCGGSDPTTNNIMEMTGALMALRWFAERGVVEPVRLFCDSMYVVNGCNDWRHNWKARGWRRKGKNPEIANLDLWQELDLALIAVPIKLEWCKGHVGIIGNERADELSLEGRESILALNSSTSADLIEQQLDYSARGGA
ncbi:ribonuclease H family protein [Mesorhizobium sp. A623]